MATGAPGTNGVWQYGEDDSEATFSALLNKAASTTDSAIGLDRGRLTTLEARRIAGLVPIIPTSVSSNAGTSSFSSTTGEISFNNCTSVNVNGIFSSTFNNYRILVDVQSTNQACEFFANLKNAGGTLSSGHIWRLVAVTGGSVSGQSATNQPGFNVGRSQGASGAFFVFDITNAGNTRIKKLTSQRMDTDFLGFLGGFNTSSTAYTDITVTANGSLAYDGKMKVYGYN
jgi:hypothetical protein